MRTLAILPIKSFAHAKQRLHPDLDALLRQALVEAMFSDVLLALKRTAAVDEVLVVSADHGAASLALGKGVDAIEDHERGHNAAAALGIVATVERGAERVLLVPADCPLLNPGELDELLGRPAAERQAVIVPDRHKTGTNALVLTPPDALAPAFGPGSCERHLTLARAGGLDAQVVEVPSLALDVDTVEDLRALQEALARIHGGAAHTRGTLAQYLRARE